MKKVNKKIKISDDYGQFITVLRTFVNEHIKKTKDLIQSSENDIRDIVKSAGDNNEIPSDLIIEKSFVCKRCHDHINDINSYLAALDDRLFKNPYDYRLVFSIVQEIVKDIDCFNKEERPHETLELSLNVWDDVVQK